MQGSRLGIAIIGSVTALTFMAACDPSTNDPAALPTTQAPAPVSPSAPSPQPPAESSAEPLDPPLTTDPSDTVLVAPVSGSGKATTAWFKVTQKKYTIRIACAGDGAIVVSPGEGKMDVPCDGSSRRVHVATDENRDRVSITASKSQRWTLSVVISKDFTAASPKPTSATA